MTNTFLTLTSSTFPALAMYDAVIFESACAVAAREAVLEKVLIGLCCAFLTSADLEGHSWTVMRGAEHAGLDAFDFDDINRV